jgi:hypothetical protein
MNRASHVSLTIQYMHTLFCDVPINAMGKNIVINVLQNERGFYFNVGKLALTKPILFSLFSKI